MFGVSLGTLVTGIVFFMAGMMMLIVFAAVDTKYKGNFLGIGIGSLIGGITVVFKVVAVNCYRRYIQQRPHQL